ncbi:hypothetical protein Tco_1268981, partial [Tanacetum coccineum]
GLENVKRKLQEVVEVRKCSWGDVRGLENVKCKLQEKPGNRKASKLVFVWADEGTKLKVDVTVVFKGEELDNGSAVRTGTRQSGTYSAYTVKKIYSGMIEFGAWRK